MSWTPSPWAADVLGDLAVRGQRRGEHEADVVLDHDVAGPVADLGLEAAERDRREAPQRAVVGGGLAGVADPELDVVDALEWQEVVGLGVGVRVDPGAGLVGGATRYRSASSRVSPAVGGVGAATLAIPCYPSHATLARMDDLLDRLAAARAGLAATRPAVEAGAPWPLAETSSTTRMRPAGGRARCSPTWRRWSPYWLGEIERVLAGDPGARPVRPGRDRPGAHRPCRTRPVRPAARAVRPDRRRPPALRPALADADAGRARAARSPSEPWRADGRGDARQVHRRATSRTTCGSSRRSWPGRTPATRRDPARARLDPAGDRPPDRDRLFLPGPDPARVGQARGRPDVDPRADRDPRHLGRRPELDGRREHVAVGRPGRGHHAVRRRQPAQVRGTPVASACRRLSKANRVSSSATVAS